MPKADEKRTWNRDDEQKPGRPPRSAHEPASSEGSARTGKTQTDPMTGAPSAPAPRPNQADGET